MIGQYLPNNNENATVPILPKFLQLNRAEIDETKLGDGPVYLSVVRAGANGHGQGHSLAGLRGSATCGRPLSPVRAARFHAKSETSHRMFHLR
jgi:hypothetical protein